MDDRLSKLRILVVEDEPIIAENISMHLDNHDFEVSGIAYDSEEALTELKYNTPDAVLLDINLDSDLDGIDLGHQINQIYQIPFVLVTSYSDKETLERAKKIHPSGYIVKPFNERTLLATLEIGIANFANKKNELLPLLELDKINRHLITPLTEREFEIVSLLYNGITNSQIAAKLFLSINTIKTHLKNIYLKLDAHSRYTIIAALNKKMIK